MRTGVFRGWMLVAALGGWVCLGQSLKVGEAAPGLALERTIPGGMGASWEALRGRPVVVEFWSTWCANCVAEIPHLNELVSKFETIQFISITDEPVEVVEPFLARQAIQGWVGLDRGGATFQAYRVEGRPKTFLVGRDGVVKGIMHPAQVNAATLSDLIAERPVKPLGLPGRLRILQDTSADPVFAVMLRPASRAKPGGLFSVDPGKLEGTNLFLKTMIAFAYGVGERRVEGPEHLLKTRYDFCVSLPDGVAGDTEALREMLERSFRLKVRREKREMDAAVLRHGGGGLKESGGLGQMTTLARMLEARLNRVVVNEAGVGSYKFFELPEKNEELGESLRSRLGIELSFERRAVEVLIIDTLELPKFRMGAAGR